MSNNDVYAIGTFNDNKFSVYNSSDVSGSLLDNTCINVSSTGGTRITTFNVYLVKYNNSANTINWACKLGGLNPNVGDQNRVSNCQGFGVATDLSNNVYITGPFFDASFNIYDSTALLKATLVGNFNFNFPLLNNYPNYFIASFNSSGTFRWAKSLSQSTPPTLSIITLGSFSICTDNINNVYVTGSSSGTLTLSSSPSFTIASSSPGTTAFLAKYDTNGVFIWGTSISPSVTGTGTPIGVSGLSVNLDSNYNVYLGGVFDVSQCSINNYISNGTSPSGTILNNTCTSNTSSNPYTCGYLVKYNSSGTFTNFAVTTGSTSYSGGSISNPTPLQTPIANSPLLTYGSFLNNVTVDYQNNVYFSGTFGDSIYNIYKNNSSSPDRTLNNSNSTTSSSNYYLNGFVVKYNSNGVFQWAVKMGGTTTASTMGGVFSGKAININVDSSLNVNVVGQFNDTSFNFYDSDQNNIRNISNTSGNVNTLNGFIAQYNSSGTPIWAYGLGPTSIHSTSRDICAGVSTDVSNNIIITGIFNNPTSFNVNSSGIVKTLANTATAPIGAAFIAQYTSSGLCNWACKMGGTGYGFGLGSTSSPLLNPGSAGFQVSASKYLYVAPPVICFKEGTKILTSKGYKLIQDLRKGDLVKTLLNDYLPIYMIGKKEMYHLGYKNRIKDQLYRCCHHQYPELFEDLIITGCHSILVDYFVDEKERENTIKVNGDIYITDNKYRLPACVDERAYVYDKAGNYNIYHFALENENYYENYGVYANGLLVETCSKRYIKELSNMTLIE